MARDDLTFQLDAIALVEALLLDDGEAYDAVLDADDSPVRLREVIAGAIGGWPRCWSQRAGLWRYPCWRRSGRTCCGPTRVRMRRQSDE